MIYESSSPTRHNSQKLYEQQFQNYQIKKMYNNEAVA